DGPLINTDLLNPDNESTTVEWMPDAAPYLVMPTLSVPDDLPSGSYELWTTIYHWQAAPDGLPLAAPPHITTAGNFVQVGIVTVN
ncbi:MAG: hypothetical protein AAF787_15655, partial [Chloroflexota bacterium]